MQLAHKMLSKLSGKTSLLFLKHYGYRIVGKAFLYTA